MRGVIYALLILAISLALTLKPEKLLVHASPEATVFVYPSSIELDKDTAPIGHRFNVTVKIENISDIKTWQVGIFFDPTIINVTRWFEPTWDPEYVFYDMGITIPAFAYIIIDVHNASANVGAALFPAPPTGQGFTGDGILCIVEFEVTAVPEDGTLTSHLTIEHLPNTYYIQTTSPEKVIFDMYINGSYEIYPEFHHLLILPIFMVITIIAIVLAKKLSKNPRFMRYE